MDIGFFLRCFIIGVAAASGFGPVFVLTLNRSATKGFLSGLATGLGGALADGIYFSLGLIGALTIIKDSLSLMLALDIFGGLLLLILGILTFKKVRHFPIVKSKSEKLPRHAKRLFYLFKSLLITLINPLIILFFMVISVQVLPEGIHSLANYQVALSSLLVMLGSLSVLTVVSIVGSFLRSRISYQKMRFLSLFTGTVFVSAAIYLLFRFVVDFMEFYKV